VNCTSLDRWIFRDELQLVKLLSLAWFQKNS